jgi:hypothetical protein
VQAPKLEDRRLMQPLLAMAGWRGPDSVILALATTTGVLPYALDY